jgi:hypothetical protein
MAITSPVPLESPTADVPLEDRWIISERLFAPCYIGGWSAAEYWGLTEQIFRTVVVMTKQKPRDRSPNIKGTNFLLRTILERAMFGLKPVWRGQVKVSVSDPTRTVLDMLNDPKLGGGIRSAKFKAFLAKEPARINLLQSPVLIHFWTSEACTPPIELQNRRRIKGRLRFRVDNRHSQVNRGPVQFNHCATPTGCPNRERSR